MKIQLSHILIYLFGAFYLFSGTVKIIDIDNFLYLIKSYQINLFIYTALAIPVIEICLGLLFIFRKRLKEVVLFSIILLVFFTLIFTYGHFTQSISDCGCFGGIDFLKMSPAAFYIRNGLLITLSFYLYSSVNKFKYEKTFSVAQIIGLSLILLVASILIGMRSNLGDYLKKRPYNKSTVLEYHTKEFVGKNIQETLLANYVTTSEDSTYLVFIFSYKCPHCLSSSILLKDYIKGNRIDKVIGLTKGTRAEKRFYDENINPQFTYKQLRYIEMSELTPFFPISFYVENDTIQFLVKGALPEYQEFELKYLNQ
jgi:hypothetical protein